METWLWLATGCWASAILFGFNGPLIVAGVLAFGVAALVGLFGRLGRRRNRSWRVDVLTRPRDQ
jgi:hypothetical protein